MHYFNLIQVQMALEPLKKNFQQQNILSMRNDIFVYLRSLIQSDLRLYLNIKIYINRNRTAPKILFIQQGGHFGVERTKADCFVVPVAIKSTWIWRSFEFFWRRSLTMTTSSIFDILRTKMLTYTTAGPSNRWEGEF